jgi:glyoxylase-like metal-dependent hydrolase (beta-lactamase superfamily II)
MPDIQEVGANIYLIDNRLNSIPGAGSVYFLNEEKKALIETGPAISVPAVREGLRKLGFKSEDIDYLIITHIHLDHSGGAGTMLKYLPAAKVVAHYRAIKHLIDPSKLVRSAIEAEGEEVVRQNGAVLPIPEERLVAAHEGDTISLGAAQVLTLLETPGHAPHHICILESRHRGVFVGDAIGHFVEGMDVMIPITPPPSFDQELYIESIQRLIRLNPSMVYFSHFGATDRVPEVLERAIQKLRNREQVIDRAAAENRLEKAAEEVVRHICAELESLRQERRHLYDFWAAVDIPMSAAEHVRYYRKKHGLSG